MKNNISNLLQLVYVYEGSKGHLVTPDRDAFLINQNFNVLLKL